MRRSHGPAATAAPPRAGSDTTLMMTTATSWRITRASNRSRRVLSHRQDLVSEGETMTMVCRAIMLLPAAPPAAGKPGLDSMAKLLLATLGVVMALVAAPAQAAPRAELWDIWLANDPASTQRIDHGAWEDFLTRYLRISGDGVHRVAYGEVTPADRAALDGYIEELAALPIETYNRPEQMAYWINLYNALTVRLVLDHYPIASIRDINESPRPLSGGPWAEKLIEVNGTPISLNDIVHRILRPIWQDPRIHYALSCGAIGCANLRPEPYQGDRLDHQLSKAAMAYVNDQRCISFENDQLGLSSLFRWYQADFGGSDSAVLHHLMAYAAPQLAMKLQQYDRVAADGFDWRLNDATP
jgi:hypothetical protein